MKGRYHIAMRLKFIGSVVALIAGLNVLVWAFSTPPAETHPTPLDFGAGIVRIGTSAAAFPAGAASAVIGTLFPK